MKEIEHKFLVVSDAWKKGAAGKAVRQGFLSIDPDRTVRVRVVEDAAFLTIKGRRVGPEAFEFEYPIPVVDGEFLLEQLCLRPLIEKTRYRVEFGGLVWEIDEFHGLNEGLVVAEVELESPDQPFAKPDWVGKNVTDDHRYSNARLVERPYSSWEES
jgi:adenylate cyclase